MLQFFHLCKGVQRYIAIFLVSFLSTLWLSTPVTAQTRFYNPGAFHQTLPCAVQQAGPLAATSTNTFLAHSKSLIDSTPCTVAPVNHPTSREGEKRIWNLEEGRIRAHVESTFDATCSQSIEAYLRDRTRGNVIFTLPPTGCVEDVQLAQMDEDEALEAYISVRSGSGSVAAVIDGENPSALDVYFLGVEVFHETALVDLNNDGIWEILGRYTVNTWPEINPFVVFGIRDGALIDITAEPVAVAILEEDFLYQLGQIEEKLLGRSNGLLTRPFQQENGLEGFFKNAATIRAQVAPAQQSININQQLIALTLDAVAAGHADIGIGAAVLLYQGQNRDQFLRQLGSQIRQYTQPHVWQGVFREPDRSREADWAAPLVGDLILLANKMGGEVDYTIDLLDAAWAMSEFVTPAQRAEFYYRTGQLLSNVVIGSTIGFGLGRVLTVVGLDDLIAGLLTRVGSRIKTETRGLLSRIGGAVGAGCQLKASDKQTGSCVLNAGQQAFVTRKGLRPEGNAYVGRVVADTGRISTRSFRVDATEEGYMRVQNLGTGREIVEYKFGTYGPPDHVSRDAGGLLEGQHGIQHEWAKASYPGGRPDHTRRYRKGSAPAINLRKDIHRRNTDRQIARGINEQGPGLGARSNQQERALMIEDLELVGVPSHIIQAYTRECDDYYLSL